MKNKKKEVRCYSCVGLLIVIAVIIALVGVFAFGWAVPNCDGTANNAVSSVKTAENAANDEGYINSENETGYYLFLPMTDNEVFMTKDYFPSTTIFGSVYADFLESIGALAFDRSITGMTFLLRFNDVKYYREGAADIENGMSLLANFNSYMEIPSSFWSGTRFVFKGSKDAGQHARNKTDIKINLRKEYYDELKKHEGNLGNVTISISTPQLFAYPFLSKEHDTASVNFSTSNFYLVSGVKDNNDGPGDNGGVDVGGGKGQSTSWLSKLMDWFTSLSLLFKIIIFSIIGVIVLVLLVKLIKWAKK